MPLAYVVLKSGHAIQLTNLHFSCTYGGLLEGVPTEDVNTSIIEGLTASAGRDFPNRPVHVVPPAREYPDEQPSRSRGRVEFMPRVACVGTFEADAVGPDADPVWDRSWLTVVWFQEEASLDGIKDALADLAWGELARDMTL
ncbi:hypothetical protein [Phytomonospora endophytica]|uniref:Uncharacterized protein n=1 Tax=Phytomonospora endophytica TaxID=714109 RepID=A0A841FG70_9ACTN|nr:hypothetical protein [Phytomonospora endophytica]MBB6035256.1 hypothetical protein [Phytomonospora endophytica]GIG63995.1 hypothetical protein Pen01_02900 [Phytomonospora endophytica]